MPRCKFAETSTNVARIGNIDLGDFPLLLAPMEDVSDPPFRALCKEYGADMMYTEFISSEGLIRDAAKSVAKLDIFDYERPIGIQIFGAEIESMREAAAISEAAGPDLVDINYGCPVKKVACRGAGAGILQHIVEVAERLQDVGIQAISIHGRTRAQMYKGEADWSLIAAVKENPRMTIPVFGNGDIDSPEKALRYKNKYGVDGVMIGRAAIGSPWFFRQVKQYLATGDPGPAPDMAERIKAVRTHLKHSLEWKGERLGIVEMRRHYANYFRGLPHFKEHRLALVTLDKPDEIFEKLDHIAQAFGDHVFA